MSPRKGERMKPGDGSQRGVGPRGQRPGSDVRHWWISWSRKLALAIDRTRINARREAEELGISQAEYVVRIMDGLGPRGRKEAYRQGVLLWAKEHGGAE